MVHLKDLEPNSAFQRLRFALLALLIIPFWQRPGTAIAQAPTETVHGFAVGRTEGQPTVTPDGSANYTIPLWVPLGRAGIQPRLTLQYSSRNGNGTVGVGWSVAGFSQITRCKRTYAQDGFVRQVVFSDGDDGDGYCLDGVRLVAVSSNVGNIRYGSGGTEYLKEADDHSKAVSHQPDAYGPTSFTVFLKSGEILTYGGDAASRLEGQRVTTSISTPLGPQGYPLGTPVSQADYSQHVRYAWLLSRVEDRAGNYMMISYQPVSEDYGYELEPNLITYTGSASGLAPTHVVRLNYTNDRPDTEITYVGGLKLLHALRLATISIGYQATSSTVSALKTYRLAYQRSASSNRSLLSSVTECDGAGVCKSPTTFEWSVLPISFVNSPGSPALSRLPSSPPGIPANCPPTISPFGGGLLIGFFSGSGDSIFGVNPLPPNCGFHVVNSAVPSTQPEPVRPPRVADLVGNGYDSVVSYLVDPTGTQYMNSGIPQAPEFPRAQFESFCTYTSQAFVFDIEGIGRSDIFESPCVGGQAAGAMLRRWIGGVDGGFGDFSAVVGLGEGAQIPGSSPAFNQSTSGPAFPPAGHVLDVNGSGRMDLVLPSSTNNQILTGAGYQRGHALNNDVSGLGDSYSGYSTCSLFADLNGDGLQDFITLNANLASTGGVMAGSATTISISMNSGHGFLPPVVWQIPTQFLGSPSLTCDNALGNYGVYPMDLLGDGKQGLVLMGGATSGGSILFLQPTTTPGGFIPIELPVAAGDGSAVVTMSGTATQWPATAVLDANGDGLADLVVLRGTTLHLYVQQGPKGDLLTKATDGFGKSAVFEYEPASASTVNVPGSSCEYPVGCLRRGYWLASRMQISNGSLPARGFDYQYQDGLLDRTGRGWIGFGKWAVTDEARRSATTTYEFDNHRRVGSFYPCASIPKAVTTEVPLNFTTNNVHRRVWISDCKVVLGGTGKTYFSYPERIETSDWEGVAGAPLTLITRATEREEQDLYGNSTNRAWQWYDTENEKPSGRAFGRWETSAYDDFPGTWLLGQVLWTKVASSTRSGEIAARAIRYRHDAPTGLLSEYTVAPTDPMEGGIDSRCGQDDCLTVRLARDDYGMIVGRTEDGSGQHRTSAFSYDPSHTFVTSYTDPVGHNTSFGVDPGSGVTTSSTDVNGLTTNYTFDGLQRLVAIVPPNGANVALHYVTDLVGNPQIQWVSADSPFVAVSFDDLGREIGSEWSGFGGLVI